jgi:general secretion pathway protein I
MPASHRNQRGFTLLEILVALVILATALVAVSTMAINQTTNASHLRDKTLAHWVAMNQIAQLQLTAEWPSKGKQQGTEEMGEHEWHWVRIVKETPDDRVRQVDFEVYFDKRDERPVTRLTSFLSQPM